MTNKYEVKLIPNKGRGVVCTRKIKAGEIIIINHMMLISNKRNNCEIIRSHVIEFDEENDAIMLGEATLLNHDFDPNSEFRILQDHDLPRVYIVAIKDIKKGEEITVSYGEDYNYSKWMK